MTRSGSRAIDGWIAIIAEVFASSCATTAEAEARAQLLVAAMEGALLLARVRRSTEPILEIAKYL